jgi:hypothetical protein
MGNLRRCRSCPLSPTPLNSSWPRCYGKLVVEAESLGRDSPPAICIVARLRFAAFRPTPVVMWLPRLRSMNTKCQGNYILFMFANARKTLQKLRYPDSCNKRREPDGGSRDKYWKKVFPFTPLSAGTQFRNGEQGSAGARLVRVKIIAE